MKRFLLLTVLLVSNLGLSQNPYAGIDRVMDEIPQEMESSTTSIAQYINKKFSADQDKLRAAFYWTAVNIDYDVANSSTLNYNQDTAGKIAYALKNRKGVCMHYAEVFKDIALKTGLEVLLIGGYSKTGGKVSIQSHQWCAAKVEGQWYLFDPTWGGGYVMKDVYVPSLNNKYYKAEPKKLLKTHMPFDYLWQFSEYPITSQEFYDGKTEAGNKTVRFDYLSEISNYRTLSEAEQHQAAALRIEKNGIQSKMIAERLEYEKSAVEHFRQKDAYFKVKDIVDRFNKAQALFNQFIAYRNNKFRPLVTDEEIKSKIEVPYKMLLECENGIGNVNGVSPENAANFKELKKAISESKRNYDEQLEFVNQYLSKNKVARELMFYRKTKRG